MSKAAERLAGIGKHGVYLVTGTFETGRMRRDRAMLIAAAELVEAVSAGIREGGGYNRFTRDQELTIKQKFGKLEAAADE